MTATTQTPVMTGLTWQEFLDLPEEYRHADLIDGELFVNPPAFRHQFIVSRLLTALVNWTDAGADRGIASIEPAVQITDTRGYMPDIAWWSTDKCAALGAPPDVEGVPDLVVEVLSPSTRGIDSVRKRNDYPTVGVGEIWFIDPDEPSVHVVRTGADCERTVDLGPDDRLTSPLLPAFALRVAEVVSR
jgi:Uma2 family endonuclease